MRKPPPLALPRSRNPLLDEATTEVRINQPRVALSTASIRLRSPMPFCHANFAKVLVLKIDTHIFFSSSINYSLWSDT